LLVKTYRHFVWRRDPFSHNHLLDEFIAAARPADWVIANGDYSCDTAFVGVSDPASLESAQSCLAKLRDAFGGKFQAVIGDHELGKQSLFGGRGGVRLASWEQSRNALALAPFWKFTIGEYVLIGVTSTLIALPLFEPELLDEERKTWWALREAHLSEVRSAFSNLEKNHRLILFCHDPSALPFLWQDSQIRCKLDTLEMTIIGHLHSELFVRKAKLLSGLPVIRFFGQSVRRISLALNKARFWKGFRVHLCPSLAGIQLLNDGGYVKLTLDPEGKQPAEFSVCRFRTMHPK
jgi:hypothetical protein